MKLDDLTIERIRSSVEIIDVISGYVQLKKSGDNYSALCPFHNERTPSFMVSESKQIFKCFGCGVGGDVFQFIMQIEGLSFPEAVKYLAERNGISIPAAGTRVAGEGGGREVRATLMALMKEANQFFQNSFHEEGGRRARAYLRERQIQKETLQSFGIGYAPSGNRLFQHLTRLGFRTKDLETAGLVARGLSDYYDKFRNRVTFPICDILGRTIAFGGRILGEGQPKYLNSPETPLYQKGNNLYALSLSRDEIRRRDFALLVEGYFDAVVPYQFGFRNVVASLGTSLTRGQIQLLGRYTRKVIVNFDPDSAGTAAAIRSIELFLEQGFHVKVVQLPGGEDPDSFLLRNGAQAYEERLKQSEPYLDFILSRLIEQQKDPFSPVGKQEIVTGIVPYLLKVPSRIERAEYVSRIANRLQIEEGLMFLEMRRHKPGRLQEQIHLEKASTREISLRPAETYLLTALLHTNFKEDLVDLLEPELFQELESESIILKVIELRKRGHKISVLKLREGLKAEYQDLLDRLSLSSSMSFSVDLVESSLQALREIQDQRRIRQAQIKIKEIQEEIEHLNHSNIEGRDRLAALQEELDSLLREKEELRRRHLLGVN